MIKFMFIAGIVVLIIILAVSIKFLSGPRPELSNGLRIPESNNMIKVTSPDFLAGEKIPVKYTCDGENTNPRILIDGTSDNAVSLVLIMDDPDASRGVFVHWLVWNIDPGVKEIGENGVREKFLQGVNGAGNSQYIGPCPPSGTHRYFFKVYALDKRIDLVAGANKEDLEKSMQGHIIAFGELIGVYSRR